MGRKSIITVYGYNHSKKIPKKNNIDIGPPIKERAITEGECNLKMKKKQDFLYMGIGTRTNTSNETIRIRTEPDKDKKKL